MKLQTILLIIFDFPKVFYTRINYSLKYFNWKLFCYRLVFVRAKKHLCFVGEDTGPSTTSALLMSTKAASSPPPPIAPSVDYRVLHNYRVLHYRVLRRITGCLLISNADVVEGACVLPNKAQVLLCAYKNQSITKKFPIKIL